MNGLFVLAIFGCGGETSMPPPEAPPPREVRPRKLRVVIPILNPPPPGFPLAGTTADVLWQASRDALPARPIVEDVRVVDVLERDGTVDAVAVLLTPEQAFIVQEGARHGEVGASRPRTDIDDLRCIDDLYVRVVRRHGPPGPCREFQVITGGVKRVLFVDRNGMRCEQPTATAAEGAPSR